jgi:cytochrome b subunit of formate dehydrogenase
MKKNKQTFWLLIAEVFIILIGGLVLFAAEGISSEVETIARLKGFGMGLVISAVTINVFVLVIMNNE